MTDKIEQELAEGMEEDLGIKAMAARLAPRNATIPPTLSSPYGQQNSVEQKLVAIEKLIAEIRGISAQIKGQLG